MLVQDTLTGYIHEVPDSQLYETNYGESPEQMAEGQMVYDGLGNPVGFLKSLKRFASRLAPIVSQLAPFVPIPGVAALTQVAQRALPSLVQRLAPTAQRLVRGLPAGVAQQFAPVAQAFQQPMPAVVPTVTPPPPAQATPAESVEGYYGEAVGPAVPGRPVARPLPPGWIPRPSPYHGRKGRRVYLRCVAWPGQKGLVPAFAAQAPTVAPVATPATVATTVQTAARPYRRVIRRRR
jgi:hypothetical protein